MKLRYGLVFLASLSLVAAGCGGSDSKSSDTKKSSTKTSAADKVVQQKQDALDDAKKAFGKKKSDVNLCRDLAMKYIAVASPESTGDPNKAPKLPKDRDKNLKGAVSTLEDCQKIDTRNRDVQQMLASTYMATNQYDKAVPLLKQLATTSKGPERANSFYAWGLAASNAQDYAGAIQAWTQFTKLAPPKDQRVPQVRQSIKALQQAQKNPPAPAKGAAADADGGADGNEGGDAKK